MRPPSFHHIDVLTRSTGAALLCSLWTACLGSRKSEQSSEILAWVILPIIFGMTRRFRTNKIRTRPPLSEPDLQPQSAKSLWIVALGIATLGVYQTENGLVGVLPALTPLLLITERYLGSEFGSSTGSNPQYSTPFVDTVWGTAIVASFLMITLADWEFQGYLLSAIPVAALLGVYVTLTSRRNARYVPCLDSEAAIRPLALRVVSLLVIVFGVDTIAFGFPRNQPMAATFMLGLVKASTWYFLIEITRHCSWCTVVAIRLFGVISARNLWMLSSDTQAFLHVTASLLTLGQVIYGLPGQAKSRSALWVLFVVPLIPYLIDTLRIAQSPIVSSGQHPIEALIHNARRDFDALLRKQSQNYTVAHKEYRRRYGIEPPAGFEAWFEFAKLHQSPIIDEFDNIYEAISPFWHLSGQDIRDTMDEIQNMHTSHSEVWFCTFSGQQAKTYCRHPGRIFDRHIQSSFDHLMSGLSRVLPDFKFLVNHLDEPRVVMPPPPQGPESLRSKPFNLTDLSRRPVWDTLTKSCSSREMVATHTAKEPALPFVTDPILAIDLCQHPEYSTMHGLTISPTSFYLFEGAVPILSTGSLSTMGDILYPSPAYNEDEFKYTVDTPDIDWDKKQNNLYWAGSTTGGFAVDEKWQYYHRQRFVQLAQNLERHQYSYLQENAGIISPATSSSFINGRFFNAAFTRIFQCERRSCRDQHAYFKIKSWADKDQPLRSRLVFDIDGNGISGRYYKLLASKSLPLKQTLLREWHDERLRPWVHYVPVSLGMEELPEIVRYLTSTKTGQGRAQEIAEQGRGWFAKAFREVDLTIYMYRLMLELARLQDPNRLAI
ncbi:hypothetical protein BDV26DRAFT_298630 [Aspergillus bertholletiae]|uniref:Glycosyl transferase CAP10 domain-containing protein n=1 Tax=Aspergillus bertholletiae TaxID=1226010 RepID=A0A5N7ARV2_9EURO|nr:hypothetical protein BDV26DRAFT_298630 [Aspergillus bertholletiae]